jgi:hypothetical protein
MPSVQHIEIQQGATFRANIAVRDENRQAVDLTDCIVTATIRKEFVSEDYVLFADTITDPDSGIVQISLTKEQTAALVEGRYVYDAYLEQPDGTTTRIVEGVAEVSPFVTRVVTDDPEDPPTPEEEEPEDWASQGFF